MEVITIALLSIISITVYLYVKWHFNYFNVKGIPHPPAKTILGNMVAPLLKRKHLNEVIDDIYNIDRDAKYIGAFDFMRPVIMLRDLELIKSVTIKNFDSFVDRSNVIDDSVDPYLGGNLFNMAGDRWKEARALLSPAFTSSKMKAMYVLIVESIENLINYLSSLSPKEREMVDTKILFSKFTNDTIATCAFGISVDSLKNPDNDFYQFGKDATNFNNWRVFKFFIARFIPWLFKVLNIKIIGDHIGNYFGNIVKSTIEQRDKEGITRPDMLQLMMNARGKDSKNFKLDITSMTAQAFIFFFGGFDTSSTQMCLIAHELAINPAIQKRLQEEIDEVMERTNGNPSYEDIQSMLYLDAVFNESMRLHAQVGLLDRLCRKTTELPPTLPGRKPFVVQPGMSIWIPVSAIHRDPEHYENPDKFDPDRYYEKKVTINDVLNLGFGIGPRSCIGNRFAILENKVLFFYLLHKFNLKPNENTCSPLVYSKNTSFILRPKTGFWLAIEPRK